MIFEQRDYRSILTKEYEKRRAHNNSYSMRAFASFLGLAPSRLSEILKNKQGLSSAKAKIISAKLNFNNMETDFFCTLVESEHARSQIAKEAASEKLKKFLVHVDTKMSMNIFEVISGWEHLAILELLLIKTSKTKNSKWISDKLSIKKDVVEMALNRLDEVGLVKKSKSIFKRVSNEFFVWGAEIPSESIKQYHKAVMIKAIEALYLLELKEREFNSVVMPVDTSKLPQARKLIKKFNRDMNKLVTNKKSDRVYYLSTQFFPVDKE